MDMGDNRNLQAENTSLRQDSPLLSAPPTAISDEDATSDMEVAEPDGYNSTHTVDLAVTTEKDAPHNGMVYDNMQNPICTGEAFASVFAKAAKYDGMKNAHLRAKKSLRFYFVEAKDKTDRIVTLEFDIRRSNMIASNSKQRVQKAHEEELATVRCEGREVADHLQDEVAALHQDLLLSKENIRRLQMDLQDVTQDNIILVEELNHLKKDITAEQRKDKGWEQALERFTFAFEEFLGCADATRTVDIVASDA